MAKQTPVLRLIMFTSKDCKFCPEVDRIVRKYVGNQKFVNVTTVDVDLNPDIANQFHINQLPTVVIGNEPILSGYMSEEDIRDRLWNKIFQSVLSRDTSLERRKEQLFALTQNIVISLTKREQIRPNIGDYVHLGVLQITNMSLLALDRLASKLIYDAGRMQGLYGPGQMMITRINPNILTQFRVVPRFHEVLKGLVKFYSDHITYPSYLVEKADLVRFDDQSADIRIYGSAYAVSAPKIGEPLCWALAGEIAGQIQAILGRFVLVSETACWGLGHTYCEFHIEILDEEMNVPVFSDTSKGQLQERRIIFQNTLMEMADNYPQSLFLNKRMRANIGDFVHISVIQQTVNALKLMDPFCGMLLFSAGGTYGLTGPGKNIIQQKLVDQGIQGEVSFEEAIRLLVWELSHPTTLLSRQHSFVDYILDEESAEIILYENVYSSGAKNVNETFCDFAAGFIKGRLQLLVTDELSVKETQCQGTGAEACHFKIVLE